MTVIPLPGSGTRIIGRGDDVDVRIDHGSISRRHAALHLDAPMRIQDLGSANGTFIRDSRSPRETNSTHPLRRLSGETIEIGVGERVNLGLVTIMTRRAPAAREGSAPAGARGPLVRDPEMRALYEQVTRVAPRPINVLILGETGVGKEALARALHDRSPRAAKPYLELNCAALPEALIEGELFGHEKGAFTHANQAQPGLFESAAGGTVFLDEIGELPHPVQVKLLRVLEDRKVLRVGGRTPRTLDVRFVTATNRDLTAAISQGTFRADLYHRLNGVSFRIPPLRERVSEIGPLAELFLAGACQEAERACVPAISPAALEFLERYAWPGNVRELRNVMERAVALYDGDTLMPEDLPAHLTGAADGRRTSWSGSRSAPPESAPAPPEIATPEMTEEVDGPPDSMGRLELERQAIERRHIEEALEKAAGNQTRAAKLLRVSLRTLIHRLDRYGFPRPRKKP